MAGKNSKYWTLGTLKSRGWTNGLIAVLLPRPRYRHQGGGNVKTWQADTVLAAEENERFRRVAASNMAARQAREKTGVTAADIGPGTAGSGPRARGPSWPGGTMRPCSARSPAWAGRRFSAPDRPPAGRRVFWPWRRPRGRSTCGG